MNDRTRERQPAAPIGLCASCRHARAVTTATGSRFLRCDRASTDARYPKYPRLPVVACDGHEAAPVE